MLVGIGFFFVTCYIVFADVLQYGAPVTPKHILTFAVVIGTCYFGHKAIPELFAVRLGNFLGCALLFLAGTGVCVITSAGRNAEVTNSQAAAARASNTERDRLQTAFTNAKQAYDDAFNAPVAQAAENRTREARTRYEAALQAEADECRSGEGNRCLMRRGVTAERRKDLEAADRERRVDLATAETARQALIQQRKADLDEAQRALKNLPAEKQPNPTEHAAAQLLAKLPYVTAEPDTIEATLLVFFPFMNALFCEIGTIVGFSLAFGHAPVEGPRQSRWGEWFRRTKRLRLPHFPSRDAVDAEVVATPASVAMPVAEPVAGNTATSVPVIEPVRQPKPKRQRPTDVQMVHEAIERLGGVANSQDELAEAMGVNKGEVSKRVQACGDFLVVTRVGNCNRVEINRNYEYV